MMGILVLSGLEKGEIHVVHACVSLRVCFDYSMKVPSLFQTLLGVLTVCSGSFSVSAEDGPEPWKQHQYAHDGLHVSPAHAEEGMRATFSLEAAGDYLDQGASAWTRKRGCVSCHTNGSYLVARPSLTPFLGPPLSSMRLFFEEEIAALKDEDPHTLMQGIQPTQVVYIAAGLAEWDLHVSGNLSAETRTALGLMFELQSQDGSFGNVDCWPPLESSDYQSATVAAMGALAAPGWISSVERDQPELAGRFNLLMDHLRVTEPPHAYARVLLLRVSSHSKGLLASDTRDAVVASIWSRQNTDGGWALRSFARPEQWGDGSRAEKLHAEPDAENPPSDGHMTGLAVLALVEAGIPRNDPRIMRALHWIRTHQRLSGRWWTRSLNTDKYHFITYSGTCYPLQALAACGQLAP